MADYRDVDERTTFALKHERWQATPVTAVAVLSLAAIGAIFILVPPFAPDRSEAKIATSLVVGLMLWVASVALGRRTLTSMTQAVVIAGDYVAVTGVYRVRTFPLNDVVGFQLVSGDSMAAARLRLTPTEHGVPRSAFVPGVRAGYGLRLASTRRKHIALITPIIDAMNAELDRRRAGTPTAERLAAGRSTFKSVGWADKD